MRFQLAGLRAGTSTHAGQDHAEPIAASPAVGFPPKTALSGDAIRELVPATATAARRPGTVTNLTVSR